MVDTVPRLELFGDWHQFTYQSNIALGPELAQMRGPGRGVEQRGGEVGGGAVVPAAVVRLHQLQVLDVRVDLVVLADRLLVVRFRICLPTNN